MFFKPRAPVTEEEREWLEKSLLRLIEMFGYEDFSIRETILPEKRYFPGQYPPTEEGVRAMIDLICSYMDIDPEEVDFHLYSESEGDHLRKHLTSWTGSPKDGTAGLYYGRDGASQQFNIGIEQSMLRESPKLVATIAHELGHVILLGKGWLGGDEEDHEHLTDLITVFFGMGIFTANSAFTFSQWQNSEQAGWKSSSHGYMSQAMFGYALAACSWMKGENNVTWDKHLTLNVRDAFKKSLKFLKKPGNTSLPDPGN